MPDTGRLRLLPKVDQLILEPPLREALERLPRQIVVRSVQTQVDALRTQLLSGAAPTTSRDEARRWVQERVRRQLDSLGTPSLRRVLNATGVVLHTNIGRAPLGEPALAAVCAAACGYVNLEYDLEAGERMSRLAHVEPLLCQLFDAEAALAVNNNAAAVLLSIDTLGRAGVVVSRGEQVEIGDSFRLPEILAKSGVPIHEVGTTNRTRAEDYVRAVDRPGMVFLKVHRSNFALHGYACDVSVHELAAAASKCEAILVYDLGSGSMVDFAASGLSGEPTVQQALHDGAALITMSGDKLLGGPQAGLVAGSRAAVDAMRRNPLARALRIDKLTLAALQATLLSYLSDGAESVPTLRFILSKPADIEARAGRLMAALDGRVDARLEVCAGHASVGGGSFADAELPSYEVRVFPRHLRATELAKRLRAANPAVLGRIKDDYVGLDMRCVTEREVELLAHVVAGVLGGGAE